MYSLNFAEMPPPLGFSSQNTAGSTDLASAKGSRPPDQFRCTALLKHGIQRKLLSIPHDRSKIAAKKADESTSRGSEYQLTGEIIDSALEVHRELGPGLLRSSYEESLCYELSLRGMQFARERNFSIRYSDVELPIVLEVPLLVEDAVPVNPFLVDFLRIYVNRILWGKLYVFGCKWRTLPPLK